MSRIIFGVILPIICFLWSWLMAMNGEYGKAAYFILLGLSNAILWNIPIRKVDKSNGSQKE